MADHIHIHFSTNDAFNEADHPREGGKFTVHEHSVAAHNHVVKAEEHEVAAKRFPKHALTHKLAANQHKAAVFAHSKAAGSLTSGHSLAGHHAEAAHKMSATANATSAKLSGQIQGAPAYIT